MTSSNGFGGRHRNGDRRRPAHDRAQESGAGNGTSLLTAPDARSLDGQPGPWTGPATSRAPPQGNYPYPAAPSARRGCSLPRTGRPVSRTSPAHGVWSGAGPPPRPGRASRHPGRCPRTVTRPGRCASTTRRRPRAPSTDHAVRPDAPVQPGHPDRCGRTTRRPFTAPVRPPVRALRIDPPLPRRHRSTTTRPGRCPSTTPAARPAPVRPPVRAAAPVRPAVRPVPRSPVEADAAVRRAPAPSPPPPVQPAIGTDAAVRPAVRAHAPLQLAIRPEAPFRPVVRAHAPVQRAPLPSTPPRP